MSVRFKNDRELDALVAEKLFGYQWTHGSLYDLLAPADKLHAILGMNTIGRGENLAQNLNYVPDFTTDPWASKQVRERMRELGWMYIFHCEDVGYLCFLFLKGGCVAEASADTEERAVALAALRALGVKDV
jgi:hypothetical protein